MKTFNYHTPKDVKEASKLASTSSAFLAGGMTTIPPFDFGNVIHTEPRDMYVSRVIALQAGLAKESAALTVNRLCGSGLQAIVSATQLLMLGDASITLAGGVEVMSNSAHIIQGFRWGTRIGDGNVHDMMLF